MEKFKNELAELDNNARDLYDKICQHIRQLEAHGKKPIIYKRLVNLQNENSKNLWKKLNSITNSKTYTKQKSEELFYLLTGIDLKLSARRLDDDRNELAQSESIRELGKVATTLFRKIVNARQGHVTEFLERWRTTDSKMILPNESFLTDSLANPWAMSTLHMQHDIVNFPYSPQAFLFGLLSFSKSASNFKIVRKNLPKSQIGLVSRKKSIENTFMIRLHVELEKLFKKPHYALNAELSSIVFNKSISKSRVEDCIDLSKKKGEIRIQKSTQSPRS